MNDYEKQKQDPYYCAPLILEPGEKARDEAGHAYGADFYALSKEEMQALLDGKQIQLDSNGEYAVFVVCEESYKE